MKFLILFVAALALASAAKTVKKQAAKVEEVVDLKEEKEALEAERRGSPCVSDCSDVADGDYASCSSCGSYVTCANNVFYERPCVPGLEWNNDGQVCDWVSPTCGGIRRTARGCQRKFLMQSVEPLRIDCEPNRVILVRNAFYGRRAPSSEVCSYRLPHANNVRCYGYPILDTFKVRRACNGRNSCEVTVNDALFGGRCPLTYKYAEVTYSCVLA